VKLCDSRLLLAFVVDAETIREEEVVRACSDELDGYLADGLETLTIWVEAKGTDITDEYGNSVP
jgi:hypothetical protein